MDSNTRTRALNSALGTKIKNFLGGALEDADHLPGKAALVAHIEEEFGEVEGIDKTKLFNVYCEMARRGQDPSKRWDLRGHIYDITARVVTKLEEADRLLPREEEEAVDAGEIVEQAAYGDCIGGDLDRKRDQERAAAQEILRRAGR
jgi:hypothetical protein